METLVLLGRMVTNMPVEYSVQRGFVVLSVPVARSVPLIRATPISR